MKLKPDSGRRKAARRGECLVDGCARPIFGFGLCREDLSDLNSKMEAGVIGVARALESCCARCGVAEGVHGGPFVAGNRLIEPCAEFQRREVSEEVSGG
jgi:hypothetical protein